MADAGVKDYHIDAALTNFSRGYRNSGYIADALFPILLVKKESDKFYIWGKEAYRRLSALRADKTPAKEVGLGLESDTYSAEAYALKALLSDRERANQDDQIDLERRKTEGVTDLLLLDREYRAYAAATNATTFSGNTDTPSPKWDAGSTEDPVADVLNAKEEFRGNSLGVEPNLMVLPPAVLSALKLNAALIDRFQYTNNGLITLDLLRNVFEIPNIIIPRAMQNTAQEGATDAFADIWTDTVGLYYVNPSPGLETRTMGITFRQKNLEVATWRESDISCDVYQPEIIEAIEVVDAGCGYLLTDVLT